VTLSRRSLDAASALSGKGNANCRKAIDAMKKETV